MHRLTGETFVGFVGCGSALVVYGLGFVGMMGASLLTLLLPPAFIGPVIVGAVVVLMLVVVPVEYLRRHGPVARKVVFVLDEGGVRLSVGWSRRYLPLGQVDLELRSDVLYVRSGGRDVSLWLDLHSREPAKSVVSELSQMTTTGEEEPAFQRGERTLDAWAERVTRHVAEERSEAGYRTADRWHDERLMALLADRQASATMRAAAGHALLRLAPQRADAVRRACSAATPPIVVAMLYAGAGAPFREAFEVIAPFLQRRDARAAKRMATS